MPGSLQPASVSVEVSRAQGEGGGMKARIMNRTVEIPEGTVMDGKSRAGHIGYTAERKKPLPVARLAPSTLPGWPKASDTPISFELKGQIPSGKNAVMITRKGRRYPNKRFKAWRDDAIYQLTQFDVPAIDGHVLLIVDYVPGNQIRRDVPGMLDAICHLLEYTGIVSDDAQVKNVQWHQWPLDREHPKCRVTIEELTS
jgi:Holliday junction resolvase RusA-like endonuclease